MEGKDGYPKKSPQKSELIVCVGIEHWSTWVAVKFADYCSLQLHLVQQLKEYAHLLRIKALVW